jgi:hypothetical protein
MKYALLLLLVIPLLTSGQAKKGTLKFLEEKHGFKEIILGNDISTIKSNVQLATDTADTQIDGITFYSVTNPEMLVVGQNVKIKKILVGTFENKITYIFIRTDKGYGESLMSTFKEAYGNPNMRPNQFIESWIWRSKSVVLSSNLESSHEDSFIFMDMLLNAKLERFKNDNAKKSSSDI